MLEGETEVPTEAELRALQAGALEPWYLRMAAPSFAGPIDPVDVHPRSVRAQRLSWEIDGPVVRVEIESPVPGSVPVEAGELYARVEVGPQTYAIPLDATPIGFSGERSIDVVLDVAPRSVRVSVYSDRFSAGARRGRDEHDVDETRRRMEAFAQARAARATAVTAPESYADPAAPFAVELDYLEA